MAFNDEIASILSEMADLLELTGADRFRVNAHAKAARIIKDLSQDLLDVAADRGTLTGIEGVGAKTADKITEYADKGFVTEHQELLGKVPRELIDVLKIPGLGPKTVRVLWQEKDIRSLNDLERALEGDDLKDVPRMGPKTIQNIKDALAFMREGEGRTPLGIALPIAESIVSEIEKLDATCRVTYAGSLRRGQETIGDIDILLVTDDADEARETFVSMEGVTKVLAEGETKSSIRIKRHGKAMQVDLRIVSEDSFGAALLYFTGSKDHNVRLREIAIREGLTLNEYGLFPDDGADESSPQSRGVEPVASETEESIYEALELPYLPPELRTGTHVEDAPPDDLITLDDVRAELHAHTTESDGKLSIEELARCAMDRGFHTIAVTDHSKSSVIANGLSEERLRAHIENIRKANGSLDSITILVGSEVDIHPDGTLDYDDELLAELDIVVASPHASLNQKPAEATERLIKAIEHPSVRILGHPCGRIVPSRKGLSPDIRALGEAAAANGVALEINSNWRRLDLRDSHVRTVLDAGALIAIDCDVHRAEGFDNLRYGVLTARRGGLPASRCVNAWDAETLHAWLRSGDDPR